MVSRYEVMLNDLSLSAIDESILILDVNYEAPEYDFETLALGGRDGAHVAKAYKESARVSITFQIRKYAISERQRICQEVCSWAKNGGVLKINDRPNEMLKCICESFPHVASVRNWTDEFQIAFTGYAMPYWLSTAETTVTITGTNASGTMRVPGTAKQTFVQCEVVPSGSLTSLKVTSGGTVINLTGLSVSSGSKVTIGYDADWNLFIKVGNTSLLNKRTGASSDDLIANCGVDTSIAVVANVSVEATFKARGCWL